jgi:TetR/AcrR family transcriptional repressor of nem operon
MSPRKATAETREALIQAARDLFLRQGYTATGVEQICAAADATKGALFHHFESKEALGRAVLEAWMRDAGRAIGSGDYLRIDDPLERALGYIDFMIGQSRAGPPGCIVGIFSQELAPSNAAMRAGCAGAFSRWRETLEPILVEAKARHAPQAAFEPASLAQHALAVLQGALILARAYQRPEIVAEQLSHYRNYLVALFEADAQRPGRRRQAHTVRNATQSGRTR